MLYEVITLLERRNQSGELRLAQLERGLQVGLDDALALVLQRFELFANLSYNFV